MMKWLLLVSIILTNSTLFAFQNTTDSSSTFPLIAYWSKGDVINFTIQKTRIDSTANQKPKTVEQIFKSTITVLDSTADSYKLNYTRNIDFDFSTSMFKGLNKNLINEMKELSTINIQYLTDERGQFQEIINQNEILTKYKNSLNLILNQLSKSETNINEQKKIKQVFSEITSKITEEQIINIYSEEIQLIHFPYGYEWNIKDTTYYEEELPIPIIDINLNANCAWYCAELALDSGYITFIDEKELDGDMIKYGISKFVKSIASNLGDNKLSQIPEDFNMSIYMKNVFTYDIHNGYPLAISNYKNIEAISDNKFTTRLEQLSIFLENLSNKKQ